MKPAHDQTPRPGILNTPRGALSVLRLRVGQALQKQRLRRGLTQGQLARLANISLKYVGEIERGEANTSLEILEHMADALGWDPMEVLEGTREPISEGVRVHALAELGTALERLNALKRLLHTLDPVLHPAARAASTPGTITRRHRRRRRRRHGTQTEQTAGSETV